MAIDPKYFKPMIYFGCDQYNDHVIDTFLNSWWDKSYSRALQYQREYSESCVRTIRLADFKQNAGLVSKLKLPGRTLIYKLTDFELPIHNRKLFIRRYGNYNRPVAQKSIMQDSEVFSFSISATIGEYGYLDFYFYPTVQGMTYVLLIPKFVATREIESDPNEIYETFDGVRAKAGKVSIEKINELASAGAKVTLQLTRYGTIYHKTGALSKTSISVNQSNVWMPAFVDRAENHNTYDIYVSPSDGLYYQTVTTFTPNRAAGVLGSFTIPAGFIDSGMNDIYFIQRPARVAILRYTAGGDTLPIFQLDSLRNPANPINYLVSVYNTNKNRKVSTVLLDEVPTYYPNVIDLSQVSEFKGKDLIIETFELPFIDRHTNFFNPIINYMNSVGKNYPSIVIDDAKCPAVIKDYENTLPHSLEEEFNWIKWIDDHASDINLRSDFRAYKLTVLDRILSDNPMGYKYLQMYLDSKNAKFTSDSGSPAHFNYDDEYYEDNSDLAVVNHDDLYIFYETCGRVRFQSDKADTPGLVYLNGKLIRNTLDYYSKDHEYIYIRKSLVDEAKTHYENDAAVAKSKLMIIDAFPKFSNIDGLNVSQTNKWYTTEDPRVSLFENSELWDLAIDDLVVYDHDTGRYVNPGDLSFGLLIDEYELSHEEQSEVFHVEHESTIEYLLTALKEMFRTKDKIEVILRSGDIEIGDGDVYGDNYEDLPGGRDSLKNKRFAPGVLMYRVGKKSLEGRTLTVTPAARMSRRAYTGKEVADAGGIISWNNYVYPRNAGRIEVYYNGKFLVIDEDYTIQFPDNYSGTMSVALIHPSASEIADDDTFDVVIFPVTMDTFVFKINPTFSENSENFVTNKYDAAKNTFTGEATGIHTAGLDIPTASSYAAKIFDPKFCRIFINGMRVSYDDKDEIRLVNTMYFDDDLIEQLKTKDTPVLMEGTLTVVVRQPQRDFFPYGPDMYPIPMQNEIANIKPTATAAE